MKNLFILLALALTLISCTTEEISSTTNENSTNVSQVETNQQRVGATQTLNATTQIVIKAVTRGFSSSIVVKNSKITKSSTGVVPPMTITITTAKWNVLKQKFTAMNLSNISTYNAPSCTSCTDAGYSETLEITHNGVTYTSQNYDSSNPPSQLKGFITYIKSIN